MLYLAIWIHLAEVEILLPYAPQTSAISLSGSLGRKVAFFGMNRKLRLRDECIDIMRRSRLYGPAQYKTKRESSEASVI